MWRFSHIQREVLCLRGLFIWHNPIHLTERQFHCFPLFTHQHWPKQHHLLFPSVLTYTYFNIHYTLYTIQYTIYTNTKYYSDHKSLILPPISKTLKVKVYYLSEKPLSVMNHVLLQVSTQFWVVRPMGLSFITYEKILNL